VRIVYGDAGRIGPWVCERTGGKFAGPLAQAIGLEKDGRLVAGILYDHYNGRSIAMHVAGDGGHWITRDLLRAAFAYPFVQLRVRKVLGFVDSANVSAHRLDEHLGFVLEARISDAGPQGDLLLYSMTAEQCRYLESPDGRKLPDPCRT
jgi:RimJ/RimL family protein N-acetyltransferase